MNSSFGRYSQQLLFEKINDDKSTQQKKEGR